MGDRGNRAIENLQVSTPHQLAEGELVTEGVSPCRPAGKTPPYVLLEAQLNLSTKSPALAPVTC